MAEQRYQAVLAVISDGETVTDVAARTFGSQVGVTNYVTFSSNGMPIETVAPIWIK